METQALRPIVHPGTSLTGFIDYILKHHAPPTTLVVCGTRQQLLEQLLYEVQHPVAPNHEETAQEREEGASKPSTSDTPHRLLTPTIALLTTSRTISLAFTPSLPALRAYLTAYGLQSPESSQSRLQPNEQASDSSTGRPILALLNPLALHKQTSSFSAQGLSRTSAAAVEAAERGGQRLVIAECPAPIGSEDESEGEEMEEVEAAMGRDDDANGVQRVESTDPWEEEIPILNATMRVSGAGERAWVGRTVKVRRIVERWCAFADG